MKRVSAKLGNMRKSADWVVYPHKDGQTTLLLQSNTRICRVEIATGKAVLSAHKGSGAYAIHLTPALGATEIDVPREVIDMALASQPHSGDAIGPGVTVA